MQATTKTMTFADGRTLPVDLDGDPYVIDETLGPWKMTPCCGAAATGVEDGIACKGCYELVFNDGPARLSDEDRERIRLEAEVERQQAEYEEKYGAGPTLADYHPVGQRVIVQYPFSDREMGRGVVVGYEDGLVDTGGPESGPGPVEEVEMVVVQLDGSGRTKVDPGNLEPEGD